MRPRNPTPADIVRSEAPSAVLSINLLGKFSLRVDNRDVDPLSRKTRALIAYLALAETQEESRERLVGLLWSESSEEKARASLRQALHEIRTALQASGFDGFRTDKLAVALDRSSIRVDVLDVLAAAADGSPHPRLLERQNIIDDSLGELESSDPMFQTWVLAKRQTIGDQIIRQLENALRAQDGMTAVGRDLAAAIINIDQTHEEACRYLIRAHVADGAIGSALKVYKTLWDLLDADYDVEPTQQTQDLIAEVKSALPFSGPSSVVKPATGQPDMDAATKPATALPEPPAQSALNLAPMLEVRAREAKLVLSVGPFQLSDGESKKDYLAQGFRRELIACFVRFREWQVRDWIRLPVDGKPEAPKDEFILDASGYETRKAIHFVLTLRDGTTGSYLWSESLTLTLENWHQSQQSLVRRIAAALNVHVSAERMNRIINRQITDLKAYDIWLFGQAILLGFDPGRWDQAAALFREVVQQMPDFAPAFSSLAQLNNSYHIVKPGTPRDTGRTLQALAYAQEAARLDPLDSRSQLCLGWSHAMAKHYEQAMIYIPLAHDLNDNDPWTLVSAANCYAFCGRRDQATELLDSMLRQNARVAPSALQWAYHTAVRFMTASYESCIAAADFAGDLNPNVPGFKAAALAQLGRREQAAAELERFFAVVRSRWTGKEPADPVAMTRWFLHLFPIADPDDWARLRDGIAAAGAPVEGLFHHQW